MISNHIIPLLPAVRECLHQLPVKQAWLYGSFSRGEETPASDVDIMVRYDEQVPVTLLTIGHISNELESVLGRRVDLVEHDRLRPRARESAYKDRILIYERNDQG